MKIVMTGATGFIGPKTIARFQQDGHSIHVLGRRAPEGSGIKFTSWDAAKADAPIQALEGADAVVHLAGEPVAQRWNPDVKKRIRRSRAEGTRKLVDAMGRLSQRPKVLVAASAIGFYGDRGEEELTEASAPGRGFLPDVCVEWEYESRRAEDLGVPVALIRIGLVLGGSGGALKPMLPAFRAGVGGPLGSGQQWMSWIHLDDLVEMIRYAVETDSVRGPWNGVAPRPVRNAVFAKALGAAVHRPAILPAPKFALKLMFGEMAQVILASQRVLPEAAIRAGFPFRYTELGPALAAIVR